MLLQHPPQKNDDLKKALTSIHKTFKAPDAEEAHKDGCASYNDPPKGFASSVTDCDCGKCNSDDHQKHVEQYNKTAEKIGIPKIETVNCDDCGGRLYTNKIHHCGVELPAEDVELIALRKYILEDGFVLATVAFHIVSLCAQPMTTPSTTMWAFKDRAFIPDMVLALLNQPGYLEGIWPSLKIVMSSNAGNPAWCAGIATTIAFFDCIRTLPALKELQNDS